MEIGNDLNYNSRTTGSKSVVFLLKTTQLWKKKTIQTKQNKFHLFDFAFFRSFDDDINFLAKELSDKEDEWEFSDQKESGKYPILISYIEHYYRRLKFEGKYATVRITNLYVSIPDLLLTI